RELVLQERRAAILSDFRSGDEVSTLPVLAYVLVVLLGTSNQISPKIEFSVSPPEVMTIDQLQVMFGMVLFRLPQRGCRSGSEALRDLGPLTPAMDVSNTQ